MEKIRLLLYCTKKPHKLFNTDKGFVLSDFELGDYFKDKTLLNGKIVAECDFEVEKYLTEKDFFSQKIEIQNKHLYEGVAQYSGTEDMLKNILEKSCISIEKLTRYMSFKKNIIDQKYLYAIHIKNLSIFDKPRELSEYGIENSPISMKPICYAPQNMMRCIDAYDNQYILISIHPEWLCKILNGEKTIEIRRKVLKEMVK